MPEVIVSIYHHNYRLAVSTGEEELLRECAQTIDRQMEAMKASGKVIAADQIAVLTALEIAYEARKAEESAEAAAREREKAAAEAARAAAAATPVAPLATEPACAAESEDIERVRRLCRLCEEAIFRDTKIGALF